MLLKLVKSLFSWDPPVIHNGCDELHKHWCTVFYMVMWALSFPGSKFSNSIGMSPPMQVSHEQHPLLSKTIQNYLNPKAKYRDLRVDLVSLYVFCYMLLAYSSSDTQYLNYTIPHNCVKYIFNIISLAY